MFNPWRYLADNHPDVQVVWCRLPRGMRGCTDGETIWLSVGMSQVQRRETVCHETVHVERDVYPVCDTEERIVDRLSALRLVDLDDLVDALQGDPHQTVSALAVALWVSEATLRCRMDNLASWELAHIENKLDLEWSVA